MRFAVPLPLIGFTDIQRHEWGEGDDLPGLKALVLPSLRPEQAQIIHRDPQSLCYNNFKDQKKSYGANSSQPFGMRDLSLCSLKVEILGNDCG